MKGIKIYTIDSKKMIIKGLPGWKPDQEQAKTYYHSIEKDDKQYKVKISDEKLIEELFAFTSIDEKKRKLDAKDSRIIISIRYIEDENYCMTIYYHPEDAYVEHYSISNYSKDESDYDLANKIVNWINDKTVKSKC